MATSIILMNPFIVAVVGQIIFSPKFVTAYVNVALLMIPVIIIEGIAGGLIGYKVYERVKKVENVDS